MGRLRELWNSPTVAWTVAGALTVAAVGAGGWVAASRTGHTPKVELTALEVSPADRKPPAPPQTLQARLEALVEGYGEEVGIAVTDVESGWTAGVDADRPYPQQSVSKLWVAIAVLKA